MQIIKIKVPATRLRKTRRQYTIILNVDYRQNSLLMSADTTLW